MNRMLARYPAMSLQVVAKIYAQTLRLKLKGARYFPTPRAASRGASSRHERPRPHSLAPSSARPWPRRAQRADRGGRGRAQARLRPGRTPSCGATVRIRDPAAWRGPLRGSLGLGETYVDGLWETDDLVALIRIAARELRDLDGLRGAVARPRALLHRISGVWCPRTPAARRRARTSPPTTTSATTSSPPSSTSG